MKSVWRIRWKERTDGRFWTVFVTVNDAGKIESCPKLFPEWAGTSFVSLTHRLFRESGPGISCKMIDISAETIEGINSEQDEEVVIADEK